MGGLPIGAGIVEPAEAHPVEQPHRINGRQARGQQADQGVAGEGGPAALEHQQFGRETRQSRNAGGRHQRQQQHARGERQPPQRIQQAGKLRDRRGAGFALNQANAGKQQGHDQAVGQDLGHRTLQAHRGGSGQGQHQQTEMAQGAVGHQPPHLQLGNRIQGPVHRRHRAGGGNPGRPGGPGLGQEAHPKAQQPVGPHLRHRTAEQHHHRNRRLAIGERLPAVQRHDRQLQAKGQQQQGQDPTLGAGRQRGLGQVVEVEAEAVGIEPTKSEHRGQQTQARYGAVQQKPNRRAGLARAAPDRHQQRGGDQHQFIGQHEQQRIAGQEGPHHPHVGGQQQAEKQPRPRLIRRRRQHGGDREQGGEQHQGQRQVVEAQLQLQAQLRHPGQMQRRRRQPPADQAHQQLGGRHQGGQVAHHQGAAGGAQQRQQQASAQGQGQQ